MAKKIAIFESYYEAAKELPPEEFKEFFSAIFERAFNGEEKELDGLPSMMYKLVKPSLEKTLELSEVRSAAGKQGGAPTGNSNASKQAKTSKKQANDKQNQAKNKQKQADKDKDKDKDKDIKRKELPSVTPKEKVADAPPRFKKPTVAEVSEYCRERGNGVNPETFVDFYEAKGWRVGNQPMKDWKACVRTWERRSDSRAAPKNSFANFQQNTYTHEEMTELERRLLEN